MNNRPMKTLRAQTGFLALLAILLSLPSLAAAPRTEANIHADRLLHHIQVLASDEFEGRAPGTAGGRERAVAGK